MAIFLMGLAGMFVALGNLCMRRSIDSGGTAKGFLIFQMGIAFLVAVLLEPVLTRSYAVNSPIVWLGVVAGVLLGGLMFYLGKALEKGPAGLTISILNGATVVPGIVMTLVFGVGLGFPYTPWHAMGSLLVLGGLFWAGNQGLQGFPQAKQWLFLCLTMFFLHVLLLILFQYRALLLRLPHPEEASPFFSSEQIHSAWFAPIMFLTATLFQIFMFLRAERRSFKQGEMLWGVMGGIANGFCNYCMLRATVTATPLQQAVIFPIFSVVTILLSNMWSQGLYKEKVNWRACQLCTFGLIVGTVDWRAVVAAMGW